MDHITRVITIVIVAISLSLIGCTQENGEGTRPAGSVAQDDHEAGDHEGHDHADNEHGHDDRAHDEGDEDMHGESDDHDHAGGDGHSLGTLTIDDTTVDVIMMGEAEPGAAVDIEAIHTDGPAPAAVRMWIGVESGLGSLKVKAHMHGDHYHGVVEVPEELSDEATLWIEVESAGGRRVAKSIAMH
jgi:hypothetical protein